jgi:hypothetical protein
LKSFSSPTRMRDLISSTFAEGLLPTAPPPLMSRVKPGELRMMNRMDPSIKTPLVSRCVDQVAMLPRKTTSVALEIQFTLNSDLLKSK